MKKIILLFLLVLSGAAAMAQRTDNGWEDWQKTSCYSKIAFRLKYMGMNGEQHYWKIQFKSDYPQLISFNYHVTDELQQYTITTHRKILDPKQPPTEVEVFTKEENIYILVDKVSLSPYPQDFADCE